MTINDISVEMKVLAQYIGGNHLTNKEAEEKLSDLAHKLDDVNMSLSIKIAMMQKDVDENCTGITERGRFLYLRHKNIEENANRMAINQGILEQVDENESQLISAIKEKFCDKNMNCSECMGSEPYDMRCKVALEDIINFIKEHTD